MIKVNIKTGITLALTWLIYVIVVLYIMRTSWNDFAENFLHLNGYHLHSAQAFDMVFMSVVIRSFIRGTIGKVEIL